MTERHEQKLSPVALHHALEAVWGTKPGWRRLATINHNVVGKRFMLTALIFFAIGGLPAMLIRGQLASAESVVMAADQ